MLIYRHPLTGSDLRAGASRKHPEMNRPIQITASSVDATSTIWVNAGEALAIAAVALGIDPEQIEAAALVQVDRKQHWSVVELLDVLGDIAKRMSDIAAADEAEAAAVER